MQEKRHLYLYRELELRLKVLELLLPAREEESIIVEPDLAKRNSRASSLGIQRELSQLREERIRPAGMTVEGLDRARVNADGGVADAG